MNGGCNDKNIIYFVEGGGWEVRQGWWRTWRCYKTLSKKILNFWHYNDILFIFTDTNINTNTILLVFPIYVWMCVCVCIKESLNLMDTQIEKHTHTNTSTNILLKDNSSRWKDTTYLSRYVNLLHATASLIYGCTYIPMYVVYVRMGFYKQYSHIILILNLRWLHPLRC